MTKEELQDIKEWVAKGWGLSIEESLKLINEIERLRQTLIYRDQEIEWYHRQLQQKEQEIKDLKFQKRPTYVTIEGTVEDVHKDLEKFIIENDQLKQEVEFLKEQLQQTQVKLERYEQTLRKNR
jgi:regulator of replication initiation timing